MLNRSQSTLNVDWITAVHNERPHAARWTERVCLGVKKGGNANQRETEQLERMALR